VRRLLFVTQRVDPDDPVLAATIPKLRALADRVGELSVLAQHAAPGALPAGIRVRTFDAPMRLGRGLRFEAALTRELRRRPDAVVAHMIPLYAILAAPLARPLGVRVVLWYTHWNAHPLLRVAECAASAITSVDRRSFPLDSPKVRAIGHGIDLRDFPCRAPGGSANGSLRLLALGRYSPAKGLDVVLRGVRQALDDGLEVRLTAHGSAGNALEREHRRELARLVGELELAERVRLEEPVRRAELPALFAEADVLVNNMRAGAPDKVVYEAAAGCLPVLASNPVFDELFAGLGTPLAFARERPEELAARLGAFAALDAPARAELGRALRERVAARHSVESWADGIVAAAEGR
jgi:glycosyltransferase involved in cell wall biosynthesis